MKSVTYILLAACTLIVLCYSCKGKGNVDNSTIRDLNLQRYLGDWYEIARFDHRFERDLSNCTATYSLKDDGTIRVINRGFHDKEFEWKDKVGKAKTTDTSGLLRVSFFGPFYSDYRVMMLDANYTYALVGSGDSDYLWILSRMPELSQETKNAITYEARKRGYDTSKLIWVDQTRNI